LKYSKVINGAGLHQELGYQISLKVEKDIVRMNMFKKESCYLYIIDWVEDSAYIDRDDLHVIKDFNVHFLTKPFHIEHPTHMSR
jgi:hypothetical protein